MFVQWLINRTLSRPSPLIPPVPGAPTLPPAAKKEDRVPVLTVVGYPLVALVGVLLLLLAFALSPVWQMEWIHTDVVIPYPAIAGIFIIWAAFTVFPIIGTALAFAVIILGVAGKLDWLYLSMWRAVGSKEAVQNAFLPLWAVVLISLFFLFWSLLAMKEWRKGSGNGVATQLFISTIVFFVFAIWRAFAV